MGDWSIVVRGQGCHHNDLLPDDANRLAAEFVQRLKDAGHRVFEASFTYGGADNITDGEHYLHMRTEAETRALVERGR